MYIRRRNAEPIRVKRQGKGCKKSEAFLTSNIIQYIQIILIWFIIIGLDMILDIRLEYAWPCWLFFKSTYDTYRAVGLFFVIFFVTFTLASDVVVYLFIPLQWILFIGSCLVWFRKVYSSERGITFPTVILGMIFFYVELAMRFRNQTSPVTIINQFLRPFAAHCIGYTIVSICFSIKTFINKKLAQRNKIRVRESNNFLFDLIDQSLPEDVLHQRRHYRMIANGDLITNRRVGQAHPNGNVNSNMIEDDYLIPIALPVSTSSNNGNNNLSVQQKSSTSVNNSNNNNSSSNNNNSIVTVSSSHSRQHRSSSVTNSISDKFSFGNGAMTNQQLQELGKIATMLQHMDFSPGSSCLNNCVNSHQELANLLNSLLKSISVSNTSSQSNAAAFSAASHLQTTTTSSALSLSLPFCMNSANNNECSNFNNSASLALSYSSNAGSNSNQNSNNNHLNNNSTLPNGKLKSRDDQYTKLELDNRKLRAEIHTLKSQESELKSQVQQLTIQEHATAADLNKCKQDMENYTSRNISLTSKLAEEQRKFASLEKRIAEERKQKTSLESALEKERKHRRDDNEAAKNAAMQAALQISSAKNECSETCKSRKRDAESQLKSLRIELRNKEEKLRQLDNERNQLRQQVESHKDVIVSRDSLRDQQQHLNEKLQEENRFKQIMLRHYHEVTNEKKMMENKIQSLENDNEQLRNYINNNSLAGSWQSEFLAHNPSKSPLVGVTTNSYLNSPSWNCNNNYMSRLMNSPPSSPIQHSRSPPIISTLNGIGGAASGSSINSTVNVPPPLYASASPLISATSALDCDPTSPCISSNHHDNSNI